MGRKIDMGVQDGGTASVTRAMTSGSPAPALTDLPAEVFDSLLEAARAGAEWAWSRLVDDIDPKLRAYVHRQGASDPDDVVGETWLHVARGIGRFAGDASDFRSWVFMIAHHRVIDERRRLRRKPTIGRDNGHMDRLGPPSPSAESEAEKTFEEERTREILGKLSPAQREAVLLRVVGGFGITEIARIMGRTPGAVNQLQRRAFRRLRKLTERGVHK